MKYYSGPVEKEGSIVGPNGQPLYFSPGLSTIGAISGTNLIDLLVEIIADTVIDESMGGIPIDFYDNEDFWKTMGKIVSAMPSSPLGWHWVNVMFEL